jgi:L-fuculose-phosphate aldolase
MSSKTLFPGVREAPLRRQMCEIGQRIWLRGYCAGNDGNHSVRVGPDRVLCTPTGLSKGFMRPADMCVVDLTGRQIGGSRPRTSELLMHLAIYRARPDVRAVVHSHPPHATAFAIAGVDLPTGMYPEAEVCLGVVPTVPYVASGDHRLAEAVVPYLKDTNTLLLGNHGTVSFAADLETAYYKLEIVDAYTRILLLLAQVGSVRMLTPREMAEVLALKKRLGLADPRLGATRRPGGRRAQKRRPR